MPNLARVSSLVEVAPRDIWFSHEGKVLRPGGIVVDSGGYDGGHTGKENWIRAGWLMGKITATGQHVPCKRTQVNGTSGAVTEVVVDNSYAFKVGDAIDIGADTNITITAIDYATHTLTIASTTVADNEAVVARDGSQTCVGILNDFVRLEDELGNAVDMAANLGIAGVVNSAMVLGDYAAIIADTTSAANLKELLFIS